MCFSKRTFKERESAKERETPFITDCEILKEDNIKLKVLNIDTGQTEVLTIDEYLQKYGGM